MKKIISLMLILILCFSFGFGCNTQTGQPEKPNTQGSTVDKRTFTGVHNFNAVETDKFIVNEGRTDYKILIPNETTTITPYVNMAAKELVTFFNQATGITLTIEEESLSGAVHNTTEKYISIGSTRMLEKVGLQVDKNLLMYHGLRIVTVDNTIFLFGAYDQGALYAVYDFLQLSLNYEIYAEDCWVIDENVKTLKLFNYDVTDVPDMALRDCYWASITSGKNNIATRFRMPEESWTLPVGDSKAVQADGSPATDYDGNKITERTFHNTSEILPPNAVTTDIDWLSNSKTQLCYTAHGNPEKYEAMITQISKVLIQALKDNPVKIKPDAHLFTITVEDTGGFCDCDACNAAEKKYGAKVGAAMVLCNKVMEKVDAWMQLPENAEYKRDNFYLMFFAYTEFISCPAHYDEQAKKYVVNHPDLQLRNDVGVYYAINDMNYLNSIYDECNDSARENALKWFDIAPVTYLWLYESNFHYYPSMFDTFGHFDTEGYQFYAAGRPMIILNQGDISSTGITAFSGLKTFLDYKLQWDSSLDSGELIDQWFSAMFGQSKDIMRDLFNQMRLHFRITAENINTLYKYKIEGFDIASVENYKLPTLNKWIDLLEDAYKLNEKYNKSLSPEKYQKIKHHIDCELVFPAYLMINKYSKQEVGSRYVEIVKYLQSINSTLGVYYGAETGAEKGEINSKWLEAVV